MIIINILPKKANTKIYTDSLNCVTTFNKLIENDHKREKLLKHSKMYIWWNIILETIKENYLNVQLIKVKGHDTDQFNNAVDELTQQAHNNNEYNLDMKYDDINNLKCIATWKSIPIQHNIRRFIKNKFLNTDFEEFLLLNRNKKYLDSNIDWEIL
jgi:hypothetical protein